MLKRFSSLNILEATFVSKSLAFTLAEVLITLGIIGVVAALTIPVILAQTQERELKTAYKKAISSAQNAFRQAQALNEEFVSLGSGSDGAAGCQNWDVFSAQFRKAIVCDANDTAKCWDMTGEKSNNAPSSEARAFVDNSGAAWVMRDACSSTTSSVKFFMLDTNGTKKPNVYGKDRWAIVYKRNSAEVPIGIRTVPYDGTEYVDGDVNIYFCPSGGCYYRGWITGD